MLYTCPKIHYNVYNVESMYNVKASFINQANMNNIVNQHQISLHSFKNLHFIAPLNLSWATMQQQMKEQHYMFNVLPWNEFKRNYPPKSSKTNGRIELKVPLGHLMI
jgi:hypothetical protein